MSKTSCRAVFEIFDGVEGSLARAFLGLSRVGLKQKSSAWTTLNITDIIPRYEDTVVIWFMVCYNTFLSSNCFYGRWSRGWSDVHTTEADIRKLQRKVKQTTYTSSSSNSSSAAWFFLTATLCFLRLGTRSTFFLPRLRSWGDSALSSSLVQRSIL